MYKKVVYLIVLMCLGLMPAGLIAADDLDDLDLPTFRDRDGYALAVTEYESASEADLLDDDPPEHTLGLTGVLQAPEDVDVLCFRTTLLADAAENEDGDDLLLQGRNRKAEEYAAVLPHKELTGRRGEPLQLAEAELASVELDRPAYEVEMLELQASAVVVEERESEELPAIVADRFIDIGHGTKARVKSMEIGKRGIMTVKLDIERSGGTTGPVIDSLYALNADGDAIGGGRWTNELDLFADGYEVELAFALNAERKIDALRIVLATEYEVVPVKFEVEGLFQQ